MFRQRMLLSVIVMAAVAATQAGDGVAQTPPTAPPRRGGLLPQRPAPATVEPISREELFRRFDLNGDSRIDEGEAEIARSRMRQQRADMLRNSSIDPLTGRPRGAPPPGSPGKAADTTAPGARGIPAPFPQARVAPPGNDELLLVPGRPDGIAAPANGLPANGLLAPSATRAPQAGASGRPKPQQPTATTGGVRAGAPPGRPGYGAMGPKADLNAGRPIGGPGGAASPGRTSGMQGGVQGRAATGRATAPQRPGLFPQSPPRVSAEDIGQ